MDYDVLSKYTVEALLKLSSVRRLVELTSVRVRAELQAMRLEDWQRERGRKHPMPR